MRAALVALALCLALVGCGDTSGGAGGPLLVAAASDLEPAFSELGELYTAQTGRPVTFTFGSSGQLAQQVRNGAPYEVFASADVALVEQVLDAGQGDPASQADYALGRLAVWTRDDAGPQPVTLAELADPRYRRIAIANPEHAPYGVAAEQALARAGLLEQVRERLVLGENVTDTLRLATSGNADVAVVALSLATASTDGRYSVVAEQAHPPLRQALVVTADDDRAPAAQAFADLVTGPRGREVLASYGFAPPEGG